MTVASSPPVPPTTPLPVILAHARAGALGQAWHLFREAGLEGVQSDPAVLAARGRMLKEDALAVSGAERRALMGEAAEAYAAAGALSASSYHLINAASLSLLAGDARTAAQTAQRVLDSLNYNPDEAETPYWLVATRAEALLLLDRADEAQAALVAAVALAPRAWEDHAPTLRQFRLICEAQGRDDAWLEALRPPRALHFVGNLPLSADAGDLRRRVREALEAEGVGFGFGALAAGADIVIAEELVARGAELNLILPASPAAFREASLARKGEDWGPRYDALLAAAATVRSAGRGDDPPDVLSVRCAAEMAMGQAALRARALQTEAVQLLVLDLDERDGEPGGSGWARSVWAGSGRRQTVIQAPRAGRAAAPPAAAPVGEQLMALLAVALEPADIPALAAALARAPAPAAPPNWGGRTFLLAFDTAEQATATADAIRAGLGLRARVAGAYGRVSALKFPGMEGPLVTGPAALLAGALLDSAPPGACHLTGAFAAALSAARPDARVGLVGDLELAGSDEPVEVYALGG